MTPPEHDPPRFEIGVDLGDGPGRLVWFTSDELVVVVEVPKEVADAPVSDATAEVASWTVAARKCADGQPCPEVADRLAAAERSGREGLADVADELRRTAARFTESCRLCEDEP